MPMSSAARGPEKLTGLPSNRNLARSRLVHARKRLDQRRLAGAVVAEKAMHLACAHRERDAVERHHGAEMLHEIADLDQRLSAFGDGRSRVGHAAHLPLMIR